MMNLDDAELVRYLDGELDPAVRARIDEAIAADRTLADRLDTLRRRGNRLRAMLKETDPPVPNRQAPRTSKPRDTDADARLDSGGWLLRAAAAVLLIAGIFSLVPPLRAWVVDGWDRIAGGSVPAAPATHLLDAPDTADVSFATTFQSFDFELSQYQVDGTIRVRTGDVDQVRTVMITRTGTEEMMPIPGGLRIINVRSSVADYDITLPRDVRVVRIVIGGDRLVEYSTRQESGEDRSFDTRPAR